MLGGKNLEVKGLHCLPNFVGVMRLGFDDGFAYNSRTIMSAIVWDPFPSTVNDPEEELLIG
jgi:hypothetical protein